MLVPQSLPHNSDAWLSDVAIHTNLSVDRKEAALSIVSEFGARVARPAVVRIEILQGGLPVTGTEDPLTLFPDGTSLVQSLTLRGVQLWWPNGMGRQPLYEARASLLTREGELLDGRRLSFGVRDVAAVANEGAPEDALPYTLVVNGERVWIRGWNWLPIDTGEEPEASARYQRLLRLAQEAHVNMLRVSGGIQTEAFYDLCDRHGIMVWQELPATDHRPIRTDPTDRTDPTTDHRAAIELPAESQHSLEETLSRHRNHPSLVLWSGESGLTDSEGRPLDDTHPVLAAMKQAVALHDPQRLWLPASPSGPVAAADPAARGRMHDVHGPWRYLGPVEHYRFFNAIDPLLHSAFSAAIEDPTDPTDATDPTAIHPLFGPIDDPDTRLRARQFLEAEGLRYGVEANRRRKWRCSGVLPWAFNEARADETGTGAVDHAGQPRPGYDAVRRAYAPFHVSAAYETLAWHDRDRFRAEVWLHNAGAARSLLNVAVTVADLGGQIFLQENLAAEAPAAAAELAGEVEWRRPRDYAGLFLLFLQVIDEEGDILTENAYLHSAAAPPIFAPLPSAPPTTLDVETTGAEVTLSNRGDAFALAVALDAPDGRWLFFSDNHLTLPPGESRTVRVEGPAGPLRVRGWNAGEQTAAILPG